MAKRRLQKRDINELGVKDYRHSGATRKNIPPAKIAAEGKVPEVPKIQYSYSPRRPPELRFDTSGKADRLPELLEKAKRGPLTAEEAQVLADALRVQEPWLEWAGKAEAEAKGFTVDPVALHIHERISAQAILKVAARQDVERTLFSDPEQDYHEAVQFYKHDIDWTNRLILGDSLQVMASLAHREDLAGKVQMIYMDPPYGVKFGSNFQPEVGNRSVKDKDSDLSREPETVKAYRDTWHLGVHSYITYLRDRLVLARNLLSDTGSLFIQISDDHVHRVRQLAEEVFGGENFCGLIPFTKTSGQTPKLLASIADYLLWFAKDVQQVKFHRLYRKRPAIENPNERYVCVEEESGILHDLSVKQKTGELPLPNGRLLRLRPMDSQTGGESSQYAFTVHGKEFRPPRGRGWSVSKEGMERVRRTGLITPVGNTLTWRSYRGESSYRPVVGLWDDITGTGFGESKLYVVQTMQGIIERCLLMTTDPGDLVLDPTCGSGTTAIVAEQWGRRWITSDTSRVAVAIARQRLLVGRFDAYRIRLGHDASKSGSGSVNPQGGFVCKTITRVTLGSIARNAHLDEICERHESILDKCLRNCNEALSDVGLETRHELESQLVMKQKTSGKNSITEADRRRWVLPPKGRPFEHWTVPFDTDTRWPAQLRKAVLTYRAEWKQKMSEITSCIERNASTEEIFTEPDILPAVVRVSGPFTVEAVQPPEQSIGITDGLFDGAPELLEDTFDLKNVDSYLDEMTRLLRMDGVRFPNNQEMKFSRVQRITGQSGGLHAEGRWHSAGESDDDPEGKVTVAVGFGPQYGSVTAMQVEHLIRSASRQGYDALVVAGFSFDGPSQAVIEESTHPKLKIHMAYIRPDINPGMRGLLKEQPGAQLFTVFGQPRTTVSKPDKNGEYTVTMEGVDIYDPVTNTTRATGADKVAAWFLDGDYDGRTFCITQAFFPDKSAWEKLAKALGGVVSEDAFDKFSGKVSLPFPKGKHKCCAVKVIDPRGNEVMQVHKLD